MNGRGGQNCPPLYFLCGTSYPRRSVPSAAMPRCKAPSVRGLSAQPTGGEKVRSLSLPPSALRAATSLAEGGKGRRIPTPVTRSLARNDRSGRTESAPANGTSRTPSPTGGSPYLSVERDVGGAVPYRRFAVPVRRTGRRGRCPHGDDWGGISFTHLSRAAGVV